MCYKFDDKSISTPVLKSNYKKMYKQSCMLAVKFLKFLCANTFKFKLEFNMRKGRVFKKALNDKDRFSGIYWKVKDPFIKEYNYGMSLRKQGELSGESKRRLKEAIVSFSEIIRAISDDKLTKWVDLPMPTQEEPDDD